MSNKVIFIFLIFSIFLLIPLLIDPFPIKQDDLNGNILQIVYLKNALIDHLTFPLWNPYINQGLPFTHDPLNSYLHPLISISFLLFTPVTAIKITYIISIFFSSITMYFLLKYFKIRDLVSIIVSLIYASSGFLVSRIIAGHLEKILTYPLLPLFILLLFKLHEKPTLFRSGAIALILSLMLFSGDIYTTSYSLFILLGLFIFNIFKNIKLNLSLFLIVILFFLFSAVKLLPLFELQSYIQKDVDPFAGSMNIFGFIYYLFLPIKPIFELIGLERFITTDFGWWEKVAFIGPIPLITTAIFILKYKDFKISYKHIIIISLLVLIILSTPDIKINPYHYLINKLSILNEFHVPSRTFAYFGMLILLIYAIFLNKMYEYSSRFTYLLLVLNILSTSIFFYYVFNTRQFEEINNNYDVHINYINNDPDIFYIGYSRHSLPSQYKLIEYELKNLNTNYGLQIKNSPARNFTKFDFLQENYNDIIPKYFISTERQFLPDNFKIKNTYLSNNLKLYEINNYTPYASISSGLISDIEIAPNKIAVNTESTQSGILIITESYFPGWKVYENGNIINLNNYRFLNVNSRPGINKYEFIFESVKFYLGFALSITSLTIWLYVVIYQSKRHYKKYLHRYLRFF